MVASNTPSRAAVLLIAALVAGAAIAPVQAQTYQRPVTVVGHQETLTRLVTFGDLALATNAGRRALTHRVAEAVGEVCPDSDFARQVYGLNYDVRDCVNFAWSGARPQIRRAIDLGKTGQAVAMMIEITGASS